MTYVKLDDGFFANPKVNATGYDGAGLYAMGLSYCGRYLTDGFIPGFWANTHPKRLVTKLVNAGLWRPVEGGYTMTDYLEFNRSGAEIKEERRKKKEAGKRGAEERWERERNESEAIASAIARAMAEPMANPTHSPIGASDAPDQALPDQELRESVSDTPDQSKPRRNLAGLEVATQRILNACDVIDPNTEPMIRDLCRRLQPHAIDMLALEVERTQHVRRSRTALAVRLLQKAVDRTAAA